MKVKCIDNKGWEKYLKLDKEYEVIGSDSSCIYVIDECNDEFGFNRHRFENVDDSGIEATSPIVHPQHYNQGIECWDYTTSHNMNFLEGNIIKYTTRWKHKNGLQDLYKVREYLNKLIETEESKCQSE